METKEIVFWSIYIISATVLAIIVALHTPVGL